MNPPAVFTAQFASESVPLQVRDHPPKIAESVQSAAGFYALRDVLQRMESRKFAAARDVFRRNYFLAQNREGASASFLLALVMIDSDETTASFNLLNRLDPIPSRVRWDLHVAAVIQYLPSFQGKSSSAFSAESAMEMSDDPIARTAIVAFKRHTVKGDSLPIEMALDRRRDEVARNAKYAEQWILANQQFARLNDCVKSLLNKVGAVEYSAGLQSDRRAIRSQTRNCFRCALPCGTRQAARTNDKVTSIRAFAGGKPLVPPQSRTT